MSETPAPHLDDALLNEYLDQALTPSTRHDVEQHLSGCAACAAHLEAWRALFASLDTLPNAPLERDLAPEVMVVIRHRLQRRVSARQPGIASALRWVFGIQALVAVIVLGLTWPVAERAFPTQAVASLERQVLTVLAEAFSAFILDGAGLFTRVQEFMSSYSGLADRLTAHPMSWLTWGMCLAAISLLWALGTSWLLTTARQTAPSSHPGVPHE